MSLFLEQNLQRFGKNLETWCVSGGEFVHDAITFLDPDKNARENDSLPYPPSTQTPVWEDTKTSSK